VTPSSGLPAQATRRISRMVKSSTRASTELPMWPDRGCTSYWLEWTSISLPSGSDRPTSGVTGPTETPTALASGILPHHVPTSGYQKRPNSHIINALDAGQSPGVTQRPTPCHSPLSPSPIWAAPRSLLVPFVTVSPAHRNVERHLPSHPCLHPESWTYPTPKPFVNVCWLCYDGACLAAFHNIFQPGALAAP